MRRIVLAVISLAATWSLIASPAAASCAADSGPAGSPIILLVTARDTAGGYTTVSVDKVFKGPDQAPVLRIRTGQTQSNVSSSVDADLTPGERYVIGASSDLSANECTIIAEDDPRSRDLRPADARDAISPSTAHGDDYSDGGGTWSLWIVFVPMIVLGCSALLVSRRRSA